MPFPKTKARLNSSLRLWLSLFRGPSAQSRAGEVAGHAAVFQQQPPEGQTRPPLRHVGWAPGSVAAATTDGDPVDEIRWQKWTSVSAPRAPGDSGPHPGFQPVRRLGDQTHVPCLLQASVSPRVNKGP